MKKILPITILFAATSSARIFFEWKWLAISQAWAPPTSEDTVFGLEKKI
jgi:hypothetical protein